MPLESHKLTLKKMKFRGNENENAFFFLKKIKLAFKRKGIYSPVLHFALYSFLKSAYYITQEIYNLS